MTNLIKAADDARRILKGFKAFAEVADALEAVGQLEQRATEAQATLGRTLPMIDDAKVQAGKTIVAARTEADSLLADAKVQVNKAKDKATSLTNAAAQKVSDAETAANTKLAAAGEVVAEAQAKRDALLAERDSLAAECKALEERIGKARAQVAKLLG